jgi:hypothetical protein
MPRVPSAIDCATARAQSIKRSQIGFDTLAA